MINKELIEARKKELIESKQNLIDQINAHNGALADCDYWLSFLEQSEQKE